MSDTDSAVLSKPLPDHLVGDGIGQMKLVHNIKSGIFIRKKLYAIIDSNDQEIIKSSGISPNKLNYNSFLKLLRGESILIKGTNFNVEWDELNINVVSYKIKVQGLKGHIKTIFNTPDVNFKSIAVVPQTLTYKENKINKIDRGLEFSYLEILFFILFLIPFIAILSLLLYQIY